MKDAVEVLLTPEGLDHFRERFGGEHYESVPDRSRRFVERGSGTPMEVFLTGHFPGRRGPGPFAFPDPGEVGEEVGGACILSLTNLIQVKLAAGSHSDLADVVFLIQAQNLDESYVENLHPAVCAAYIQCLEEKQREDEFDARQ